MFDEMDSYESSKGSGFIATPCFLAQYSFGLAASHIFAFFAHLTSTNSIPTNLCMQDLALSFGASIGVFAGSSGGENPCLHRNGGGPYGFLLIFFTSFLAVLISKFALGSMEYGSVTPAAALAAAGGVVTAGFAEAMGVAYANAFDLAEDDDGGDEEEGVDGIMGGRYNKGGKANDNEDLISLRPRKHQHQPPATTATKATGGGLDARSILSSDVLKVLAKAAGEHARNPEGFMRAASVLGIAACAHVLYGTGLLAEDGEEGVKSGFVSQ